MSTSMTPSSSLLKHVQSHPDGASIFDQQHSLTQGIAQVGQHLSAFSGHRRQHLHVKSSNALPAGAIDSISEEVYQPLKDGLALLQQVINQLGPLWSSHLDDYLAQAASSPDFQKKLKQRLSDYGLSDLELRWLFNELKTSDFRLVDLLVNGNADNLKVFFTHVGRGEHGLANAGFMKFTGDADSDARVTELIKRCRGKGVTACSLLAVVLATGALMALEDAQKATPN